MSIVIPFPNQVRLRTNKTKLDVTFSDKEDDREDQSSSFWLDFILGF